MISALLGYKWAVRKSSWMDALGFGILVLIVNTVVNSFFNNAISNNPFITYLFLGLSAFLVAMFYNAGKKETPVEISVKVVIVSIITSVVIMALLGIAIFTAFVSYIQTAGLA